MAKQTMTKKKGLKKGWRIVLGILAGLILLYAVLGVLPRRENYALANPMMKEGALPLLIIILLIKPNGLFGEKLKEKV